MERKAKMSGRTHTAKRKLGDVELAAKTWKYFEDLEGPTDGDAKLR